MHAQLDEENQHAVCDLGDAEGNNSNAVGV